MNIKKPSNILENLIKDQENLTALANFFDTLTGSPVANSLLGAMQFISKVQEHFFAKKIQNFLYALNDVPIHKRQEQINSINNSDSYQQSVGEIILEQLQQIDSDYKPQVLGRLFAAFCNESINFDTYLRLSHIVKNTFYQDLIALKLYSKGGEYYDKSYNSLIGSELLSKDYSEDFESMGLLKLKSVGGDSVLEQPTGNPKLTDLGELLIQFGL